MYPFILQVVCPAVVRAVSTTVWDPYASLWNSGETSNSSTHLMSRYYTKAWQSYSYLINKIHLRMLTGRWSEVEFLHFKRNWMFDHCVSPADMRTSDDDFESVVEVTKNNNLFIDLGFYVAFNTVQVISRRVVGRAEETSIYSSLGFCTVKLLTSGKQLPVFPLEAVPGTEPHPQRWEARVLPLCHCGP